MRPLVRIALSSLSVGVLSMPLISAASAVASGPSGTPPGPGYSNGGGCGSASDGCDRRTAKEWNNYAHEDHKYDFDEFFGYEANDHDYWDQDRHWYERGKFPPECKPAEPKPCPKPAPAPCPTC